MFIWMKRWYLSNHISMKQSLHLICVIRNTHTHTLNNSWDCLVTYKKKWLTYQLARMANLWTFVQIFPIHWSNLHCTLRILIVTAVTFSMHGSKIKKLYNLQRNSLIILLYDLFRFADLDNPINFFTYKFVQLIYYSSTNWGEDSDYLLVTWI